MRLLTSPQEISKTFSKLLTHHERVSFAVAWASTGFDGFELLKKHQSKIRNSVVGTHFHQTHPDFIETFNSNMNIRFILEADELFHPKLFLFESGKDKWACIIGSANFTKGGFQRNQEVCIALTNEDAGNDMRRGCRDILNECWEKGRSFKEDELEKYREVWKRHRIFLKKASGRYGDDHVRKPIEDVAILKLSWDEYIAKIKKDDQHQTDIRIEVLEAARSLFKKYSKYRDMPDEDRKGIAGFINGNSIPWRWFGSMQGAGRFMGIVSDNNAKLSKAIGHIPLSGPVSKDDYLRYIDLFCSSFKESKGHGIATATRLLAMKRPDYFVCFDKANSKNIQEAFGIRRLYHQEYERYWDDVIERILDSSWWNARRPENEIEAEIWEGRAAFLDAVFYDPNFWR